MVFVVSNKPKVTQYASFNHHRRKRTENTPYIYGSCIIAAVAVAVALCSRALLYIITILNAFYAHRTIGIFHFITDFFLFSSFATHGHGENLKLVATILYHLI